MFDKICPECQRRMDKYHYNYVPGDGPAPNKYLLIGEAPGENENQEGRPFVGLTGTHLREFLRFISRSDVAFANSVSVWPGPGNPTPSMKWRRTCRALCLSAALEEVRPQAIVCIGGAAMQSLLDDGNAGLTKRRRSTFHYHPDKWAHKDYEWDWSWVPDGGIPFVVTWHPSYVMFRNRDAQDWWESDLHSYLVKDSWQREYLEPSYRVKDCTPPALLEAKEIIWDIETTGLDMSKEKVRCFAIKTPEGPATIVAGPDLEEQCREIVHGPRKILGHNLAFDIQSGLGEMDIPECEALDTMYLHYLLDERYPSRGLKHLARLYTPWEPQELPKGGVNHPLEEVIPYNASDALVQQAVYAGIMQEFTDVGLSCPRLVEVYSRIIPILAAITRTGVPVDPTILAQAQNLEQAKIDDALIRLGKVWNEKPMLKMVDLLEAQEDRKSDLAFYEDEEAEVFNEDGYIWEVMEWDPSVLDRPHDLSDYIFGVLGTEVPNLPGIYRKDGRPRASKEVLEEVGKENTDSTGFVQALLDFRAVRENKRKYVDDVAKRLGVDGRVRARISVVHREDHGGPEGTVTGRWSISRPALHNIPKGHIMRKAFRPLPSHRYLVATDRCQAELTDLAQLSGDPEMIRAITEGEDLHSWMVHAAKESGRPIEGDSHKERRARAKNVNFGILYGISPYGMDKRGWFKQDQAEFLIEEVFFGRFKTIKAMIESAKWDLQTKGFVETPYGRRRNFPKDMSWKEVAEALRQGFNFLIQSTANDINALILALWCELGFWKTAFPIMVKHDEIIFSTADWRKTCELIEELYSNHLQEAVEWFLGMDLQVPLRGDRHVGRDWSRMHYVGRVETNVST